MEDSLPTFQVPDVSELTAPGEHQILAVRAEGCAPIPHILCGARYPKQLPIIVHGSNDGLPTDARLGERLDEGVALQPPIT
jgi:hypothetical protein